MKYTIELSNDDDGQGWFVHVLECPGCMSDGETIKEALDNIQDALVLWLESVAKTGWVKGKRE